MRHKNKRHIFFPAGAFALLFGASILSAEVVDKIAIVVNDEIITDSEIQMAVRPVYEKYKNLYKGDKLVEKLEEAKQKIVEQIIDDRLILSEAKKRKIEVDEKEVDEKINEVVKRVGSKDALEKALADQYMSLRDLRTRYREQIMTRMLIDEKVGSRIFITPVDIVNYYNAHTADFSQPEELKLMNILISLKKYPETRKASELAKEVSLRLKEGCDFAGLAKIYSDGPGAQEGGQMGWVNRGYLLPEIDKVVFEMKEGKTSDIIQTSLGYHVFKVEEKKPARTMTLKEARNQIEQELFKEQVNEKLKGWIENLKKNAYIAFK